MPSGIPSHPFSATVIMLDYSGAVVAKGEQELHWSAWETCGWDSYHRCCLTYNPQAEAQVPARTLPGSTQRPPLSSFSSPCRNTTSFWLSHPCYQWCASPAKRAGYRR